jgi:hypothetical protein
LHANTDWPTTQTVEKESSRHRRPLPNDDNDLPR